MHIIPAAVKIALVQHTAEHAADEVHEVLSVMMPSGAIQVNVYGKDQTSFNSYTITRGEIKAYGAQGRV